jgi:hypothetical protein
MDKCIVSSILFLLPARFVSNSPLFPFFPRPPDCPHYCYQGYAVVHDTPSGPHVDNEDSSDVNDSQC